ncbi:MAG: hypothetical protein HYW48_05935 [Deltaproteobacteria bacterium]|nr:hypothetical protein [Deltaproteobacteria bacterium]
MEETAQLVPPRTSLSLVVLNRKRRHAILEKNTKENSMALKLARMLLIGAFSLSTPSYPQIKPTKPEEPCWDYVNNYIAAGGLVSGFTTTIFLKSRVKWRGPRGRIPKGSHVDIPSIAGFVTMVIVFGTAGIKYMVCTASRQVKHLLPGQE